MRNDTKALTDAYPKGVTTITWTATDAAGNKSTCDQSVTVNDNEPPAISCPGDIEISNEPGACSAKVTYNSPSASDNCPGATIQQLLGLPSGSVFPIGRTTNAFKVTDSSGNTAACSFVVTVNDTEAPKAVDPADILVHTDAGQCYASSVALIPPQTSDNCGVQSVSSNAPTQFSKGSTLVKWTVIDIHGNKTTCQNTVHVIDAEPPTLGNCPAGGPFLYNSGNFTVGPLNATDNCGLDPLACVFGGTIDTSVVGPKTLTFKAVDTSGNVSTENCVYQVAYRPAQSACLVNGSSSPGHTILPPINSDGSSVFKQGSTVPAKFRVFDANCNSIGSPGVVVSFNLVQIINGTTVSYVTDSVDSTTPDSSFRWDSTERQWIFNINTKNLAKNKTYIYQISLNDGTNIQFQFGLK